MDSFQSKEMILDINHGVFGKELVITTYREVMAGEVGKADWRHAMRSTDYQI